MTIWPHDRTMSSSLPFPDVFRWAFFIPIVRFRCQLYQYILLFKVLLATIYLTVFAGWCVWEFLDLNVSWIKNRRHTWVLDRLFSHVFYCADSSRNIRRVNARSSPGGRDLSVALHAADGHMALNICLKASLNCGLNTPYIIGFQKLLENIM